jgi:hypothetical protein
MALHHLLDKLPTHRWRREIEASFEQEEGFDRIEAALLDLLAGLARATSEERRLASVRSCVETLNGITAQHGALIETREREDLVAFILAAASEGGLGLRGDPTEPWRTW